MELKHEPGKETQAYIEPGIEQQVLLAGLAAVAKGLRNKSIKMGGFFERKRLARNADYLRTKLAAHIASGSGERIGLDDETVIELAHRGIDRILSTGEFGNSFMPAAPGMSQLELELTRIAGEERMRVCAEEMSFTFSQR